ncbi:hypothetical protein TNCV_112361 [Trichonephila clavipes]|nr:hypothetical protein TNCV_112361 [Trichonephila clavipes]
MKDYIDIDNVNNFTCETCDISEVTRKTHHSIDISQSSQILQLLHAVLCGPINIESDGGAKYFMKLRKITQFPFRPRHRLRQTESNFRYLNDVQNQIPVRRSERLKSKQMSVHLTNKVPNSYFEAKNIANWQN